jgi:hypothetical protein
MDTLQQPPQDGGAQQTPSSIPAPGFKPGRWLKFVLFGLIIIVVVLVVLLIVWLSQKPPAVPVVMVPPKTRHAQTTIPNTQPATTTLQTLQIPNTTKPDVIPQNFPWEASVQVQQYVFRVISSSEAQILRTYTSQKSLAQNFTLFSNFFKNNSWTITNTVNTTDHKVLVATQPKLKESMYIDLSKNSQGQVIVALTYNFMALQGVVSTSTPITK